ncbi:hypothetical protein JHK85_047690 [Glycine max]|nr:hypothetical protein JHK85_047690 [Glycine max]
MNVPGGNMIVGAPKFYVVVEMVMITAWITDLFAWVDWPSPFNCSLKGLRGLGFGIKNSGCFGCCVKPTPIIAVDEPAKGLRIQGQTVRKPHISDGFWSSSTCDLDNSNIQSQRSISSVSTSNQILYHSGGTSTPGANPEFAFFSGMRAGFSGLEVANLGSMANKKENPD